MGDGNTPRGAAPAHVRSRERARARALPKYAVTYVTVLEGL